MKTINLKTLIVSGLAFSLFIMRPVFAQELQTDRAQLKTDRQLLKQAKQKVHQDKAKVRADREDLRRDRKKAKNPN